MNEADLVGMIAQFGAAGLVAWMWLTERRTASEREKQLTAAHERVMAQRAELDVLVRALEANTRAITALEVGQRHVLELVAVAMREPGGASSAPPVQAVRQR
jgi:hypothetical protein